MFDIRFFISTDVDFATLINFCREAVGHSPAKAADTCGRPLNTGEKLLSCLGAMEDPMHATVDIAQHYHLLGFITAGAVVALHEDDVDEFLNVVSGMKVLVIPETTARAVKLVVVKGDLEQWRHAVVEGTRRAGDVGQCFSRIRAMFESNNMRLWLDFGSKNTGLIRR